MRGVIRNFPTGYPIRKKILANLIFFVGTTRIRIKGSYLSKDDYLNAKKILKKGDIVLVGNLRRVSRFFIRGPLTHSMLAIGDDRLLHSVAAGVETMMLDDAFNVYDTMLVLRFKNDYGKRLKKAVKFAKKQLGKPFNFEFCTKEEADRFYCSELVYFAFKQAGIDVDITKKRGRVSITGKIFGYGDAIHPMHYITDDLEIAFASHNLEVTEGSVAYRRKK